MTHLILSYAPTTILIRPGVSVSCPLLQVRLSAYIVNLSEFYSYRIIGKLTAFLHLQELCLRNKIMDFSTTSTWLCVCVCVCVCHKSEEPLGVMAHTVAKRREVCGCEGWVWDLDVIGDPSVLRLIRKAETLVRIFPTLDLSIEEVVSNPTMFPVSTILWLTSCCRSVLILGFLEDCF